MYKAVIPLILLLLLAPVVSAPTDFMLDVVLTSQNPYPAEPGKNVNIKIEIQNTGNSEAVDVEIELIINDPFTLLPGQERTSRFTKISPQDSAKVSYNLAIDTTTLTNAYELVLYLKAKGSPTITEKITIDVMGNPELILQELTTSPEEIEPGGKADLIAKVKNVGTGTAKQINGNISFTSTDIVPELSKGLIYIDEIKPGETGFARFSVNVGSSAEDTTYTGNIQLNYLSANNTKNIKLFTIGLPIRGKINLQVIKREPDFQRGRLRIEVANLGTTEAKSLEARLVINNETIDVDYTSTLKPNKKTTFDFPLLLEGKGELVLSYIGPGIESNSVSKEIVLNYVPPRSDGTGTLYLILFLVIVAVVYLLLRRRKKKRKKH